MLPIVRRYMVVRAAGMWRHFINVLEFPSLRVAETDICKLRSRTTSARVCFCQPPGCEAHGHAVDEGTLVNEFLTWRRRIRRGVRVCDAEYPMQPVVGQARDQPLVVNRLDQ